MEYKKVNSLEEATHIMYDLIDFEGTTQGKFYEIFDTFYYIDDDGDKLWIYGWFEIEHSYKLYKLIK